MKHQMFMTFTFLLKDLKFQGSNTIKYGTCIQFVLTKILDSVCTLS